MLVLSTSLAILATALNKAMLLRLSLSPSKTSLWGKNVWKRRVCASGVAATFSLARARSHLRESGKKVFLVGKSRYGFVAENWALQSEQKWLQFPC